MNDRLSRNSLTLVGKVNGDELVFLRVPVLDGTLWNVFGYYRIPTKTPGTLRIKMSTINFKKVGRCQSTVNLKELRAEEAL